FEIYWLRHVQDAFWGSASWMVLEIIPPKNIEKSPKPMETLFAGFAGAQKGYDVAETYIDGMFPDAMSLEIVSTGGDVHMYIRTMKKYRHLVEAFLYGQYPDVEIVEVPDYVNEVPVIVPNGQWDVWGADIAFTKKEEFYPIKTYKAFEEDITGTMIDPLAGLMEVMGKIGPGQNMWLQWVIASHDPGAIGKKGKAFAEKLKGREKIVESPFERAWRDLKDIFNFIIPGMFAQKIEFPALKKKEEQPLDLRLSPVERDTLKAVEENLGKLQFSVKGRYVYVGRRENYNKSVGLTAFWGALKQFGDDNLNGFKPDNDSKTFANYVMQKSRLRYRQRKIFRRYKSRSRDGLTLTLSSEELATLFHLPDMNVMAPTLPRVEAKRGGAPANLPIE
ncbi:MAG: hypothetical protein ACD_9C00162G0002, partial [uncultured bacterium]